MASKIGTANPDSPAHSKAARKKAGATMSKLASIRQRLAAKHGAGSVDFTKPHLLGTVKRLNLTLADIPEALFKPFGATERKKLLAQRAANGSAHPSAGIGIPLDAIPERPAKKVYGAALGKNRAHPNSELISKVLDQLGRPDLPETVGERLLAALDKLLSG